MTSCLLFKETMHNGLRTKRGHMTSERGLGRARTDRKASCENLAIHAVMLKWCHVIIIIATRSYPFLFLSLYVAIMRDSVELVTATRASKECHTPGTAHNTTHTPRTKVLQYTVTLERRDVLGISVFSIFQGLSWADAGGAGARPTSCLLYTSPSPRD